MATQHLEVKRDIPVVIETPEGFVQIVRTSSKRIDVILPGDMKAWHGMERATEHARFLRVNEGRVEPDYEVIVPVVNEDGALVGLKTPAPICVG
jgi:hypothetical protein